MAETKKVVFTDQTTMIRGWWVGIDMKVGEEIASSLAHIFKTHSDMGVIFKFPP
jgi:hypothetical protein